MRLTWLGHSSIKIETGSQVIYIDPYAGPDEWYKPASLILISRFHFDHCSQEKVKKATGDATHILGTTEVASQIYPCGVLHAGESKMFNDVEIVGMPATNPHADLPRHTEEDDSIGFVILAEKKTIYYMSDSDYLPQTQDMKPDILLIAAGGTYTAAPKEAAKNAQLIMPKLAIPIHWGGIVGTRDDADLFRELANVPVKILEPGSSVEI
ncbi:Beta-lactamase superfamily domain protein [uncultured archaeon]|nr:Beta-lactamase superfamily domain protein [uncultured archaeon]